MLQCKPARRIAAGGACSSTGGLLIVIEQDPVDTRTIRSQHSPRLGTVAEYDAFTTNSPLASTSIP